jgi:hypothetical protein
MFVVGGVLSVWDGAQRYLHPAEVQMTLLGFAVLGLGCLLDGLSWLTSVRDFAAGRTREACRSGATSARPLIPRSPPCITRTLPRCSENAIALSGSDASAPRLAHAR